MISKFHTYLILICLFVFSSIPNIYGFSDLIVATATRPLPHPLYGVTIDDIQDIDAIVTSLKKLPVKPTVRIVFDEQMPAEHYKEALTKLHPIAYVMGELLDSCPFSKYSIKKHKKRVNAYVRELGDLVDIWEIGNEINGEWLGKISDVKRKLEDAYSIVKNQNYSVALTLFYNEGCSPFPENEMFRWAAHEIPEEMKEGLDYVFISYYGGCSESAPDWQKEFFRLHKMFPNAKIGFGESGTEYEEEKQATIQQMYALRVNVPNYVGGYFWWYFVPDMVPHTKPLWEVLANSMLEQRKAFYVVGEENYPDLANGLRMAFWTIAQAPSTPPAFRLLTEHSDEDVALVEYKKSFRHPCGE